MEDKKDKFLVVAEVLSIALILSIVIAIFSILSMVLI